MVIDVTMPQLGESVAEGTVSKWLVREGDVVQKDQPLVEIATDKADSELPAPYSGRVIRLLAKEGDVVAVKAVLCQIEEGAGPAQAEVKSAPVAKSAPPPPPPPAPANGGGGSRSATGTALASPTARREALERDVNLDTVRGSGERGRITREDVVRASSESAPAPAAPAPRAPRPRRSRR